ncbi:MAG: hypothetical protein ACD_43C00163G0002 [uncultured bacterium]|nr:MAG: hypothetical protein ACD_43C00163G0002 [uncultured bacterium]
MDDNNLLDFFSEKERAAHTKWRKQRTTFFSGILKILSRLGVSANSLSVVGILAVLLFPFLVSRHPYWAIFVVICHLFFDALDGPMARFQNKLNKFGSLLDIIADHTAMVMVVVGLLVLKLVNPIEAVIYVYVYIILIVLIIVRNIVGKSPGLIIRTKYILYISYVVFVLTNWQIYSILLPLFIILSIIPLVSSLVVLSKYFAHD